MSTDQAPARDVDDVLASIDDVLADNAAPAPAPTAAPTVPAPATASPLVKDLTTAPPTPAYPPSGTVPAAPKGGGGRDWWTDIFDSQDADLDTNTGRPRGIVPTAPVTPPRPPYAPFVPPPAAGPVAVDGVRKDDDLDDDAEEDDDDQDAEEDDAEEAPAAPQAPVVVHVPVAPANAPVAARKGMTKRGRQAVFALSTYAFGWSLGLHQAVDTVLVQSTANAPAVGAGALVLGIAGLATRTKAGGLVFLASLPILTLTGGGSEFAWYASGGALAAGSLFAYWRLRTWLGKHGNSGPWRVVRWLAFVPAAVSTTALILHGTN